MGLKVDASFLKFVTMGAVGARRVRDAMRAANLEPIELERFSCSNKIWTTKVKRLRMPDLLCVRTGIRVEVRAKSKLSIKMSDAENNPGRRWDAGLRANDLIAFVLVRDDGAGRVVAANNVELFEVAELQATVGQSRLGPPKSASEGAEKDREWPSITSGKAGVVTSVDQQRIVTRQAARSQSYQLRGKSPYVAVNGNFDAESQFLAGVPAQKAAFPVPAGARWDPRPLLVSASPMDRHVAVKALGIIGSTNDLTGLLNQARADLEHRVRLEAAASAARLGSSDGLAILRQAIQAPAIEYLAMEAVLILAEYKDTLVEDECAAILIECANNAALAEPELRQAAIWGLGSTGLRRYNELLPFLNADNEDERIHAVAAFGSDLEAATIRQLVDTLSNPQSTERTRASISFVLSRLDNQQQIIPLLVELLRSQDQQVVNWASSILGQLDVATVNIVIQDQTLLDSLRPIQLLNPSQNWTREDTSLGRIAFVSKQKL